ncbi:hypothetical protein [Tautonia sociabilis]|uniref:Uncharacterized protein n=1 Tax=Tautonia sociabilis TaxID=2080755 RepID=A0A432MES8_9BACT|nr:hypothetical protein [Tautonia sociabilis]RUL84176.1 hypothetical protein TsocGM_20845 [Tautonia sociabilis]
MKALLARIPRRRAIGLHVGDREVAVSRMAFTLLGPVELERRVEPRPPGPPTETIRSLLEPIRARGDWHRAPIAVGMPGMGVFFSTRPVHLQRSSEDQSPQVLLHEILQSANLNIDHMDVDAIRWQPGRLPLASVAACRKKALAPILEALEDCGVRPYQVEPAPCGLLRAAVERHRTPRRCPSALRVFLGKEHALAVLTAADTPLMWRYFPLQSGTEGTAILSTFRFISNSFRVYGGEAPPAAVIIHGRPDLTGLGEGEGWAGVSARVLRYAGPAYDAGEIASGLALGCHPQANAFNLARHLRPPEPILSQLPWGQLAVQSTALAVATLLMIEHRRDVERQAIALHAEQAQFPWLRATDAASLRRERDDLRRRAEAVEHYLSSRIVWTDCIREVADLLPDSMTLTALEGFAEYSKPHSNKGNPKRSLALSVDAPIPAGGAISPEVEGLIGALRDSPVLEQALPEIGMAGLRWGASGPSRTPAASFTVLCLPKGKGSKKRS